MDGCYMSYSHAIIGMFLLALVVLLYGLYVEIRGLRKDLDQIKEEKKE